MAMIKCPECGHEISDKAPFCPSCGVAIAGKVVKCPVCGNVYFKVQKECPKCHHLTAEVQAPNSVDGLQNTKETSDTGIAGRSQENGGNKGNSTKIVLIVSLIIALVVCGVCFYFYSNANSSKEKEAYEFAMTSNDPMVLKGYLDTYADAPQEHRDSIEAHLAMLEQVDQDWANAVVSGSKSALEQYIRTHPNSQFKGEALHLIDSIDWAAASHANTVEAYESYIEEHPDGEFMDEANENMKNLNTKIVQPEERQLVVSVMKGFLQGINNKDEDALANTVNPLMTSFLGKQDATKSDVITFMHKLYKPNVTSMNWQPLGDYKINKKEVGDQQFEYSVAFSALQDTEHTDATHANMKYNIKATVNSDGLITSLAMTRILD